MSKFPTVKILVVDDRPANLIAMQAAFQGCGYIVIECLSGLEALEHVKNHDFACILLDVQMPILDGFGTARLIRKEPRSRSTPIIFATAINRTEEYEEFGYVAGAVDFLFKPFNINILRAKVAVFVELYLQHEEIKRKNILLEEAILKAKENEKLKRALASRDEFLMMASHELKTPITPLTLQMEAFIQIFEEGSAATMDPVRLLRMLHTSHGQVNRLSRLINDLVDVSKLSTGKFYLDLQKVNLPDLINKVITDFKEQLRKSGCEIKFNGDEAVIGLWDGFRIEQVLVNLLTNAMKYGAGKPIEIEAKIKREKVVFSIKDNGIGIEPEAHSRIFQRFERAVSPMHYSGLGLGLYISHQIVSYHNGRIWVESAPDAGARFSVELPLN
ncbi:MAG TPA: hybrid sensor histidine kinase/response regulator [Bacteriovoracaceae bacterium]|nr:hybrid sensor histidine kinase/response regulator [Bacteriovoracaceae bacterium]